MHTNRSQNGSGVQLDKELERQIEEWARNTGMSASEVIRAAFEQYAGRQNQVTPKDDETLFDAMNRLGLIGCVKGGPPDLSANPKYFEGFGESA